MSETKILYFEPHSNLYGSERSLLNLLRIMKSYSNDFSICVISNSDGVGFNKELDDLKIRYYPIFKSDLHLSNSIVRIYYLLKLFRICVIERPSIIHLNQIGGLAYLLYLKTFLYSKFKLIVHNRHQDDSVVLKKFDNRISLIDHIISVSQNENIKFKINYSHIPSSIIYNPFELNFELPVVKNKNKFLCVSRINQVKNQFLILEALSLMKADNAVNVDLFGDIDSVHSKVYADILFRFTEDNNLQNRITFRGFDVSVSKKFRNYKCLILPSLEEAMGRVIVESFIKGIIPIVLDADTGAREVIIKMGLMELLFMNRANCLLSKINYINDLDQESYNRIVLTGQKWILANLNDKEYLKKINSIYA